MDKSKLTIVLGGGVVFCLAVLIAVTMSGTGTDSQAAEDERNDAIVTDMAKRGFGPITPATRQAHKPVDCNDVARGVIRVSVEMMKMRGQVNLAMAKSQGVQIGAICRSRGFPQGLKDCFANATPATMLGCSEGVIDHLEHLKAAKAQEDQTDASGG